MTNTLDLVKAAIVTRLGTDATLLTLLGSAKIYDQAAPQGTAVPYVIFATQADRTETSDPQRKEDLHITIKAVTAPPPRTGGAIAERVDTLMDGQALTLGGTLRNFWLHRTEGIDYLEPDGYGGYFVHRGAIYRVRVALT